MRRGEYNNITDDPSPYLDVSENNITLIDDEKTIFIYANIDWEIEINNQ